ncbi:MAG: hypothetical protein ACI4NA_04345, partial [Succinivibrio sp.]
MTVAAASPSQGAAMACALLGQQALKGQGEAYRALAAACLAQEGAGAAAAAAAASPAQMLLGALQGAFPQEAAGFCEMAMGSGDPKLDAALSLLRSFCPSGKASQEAAADPLSDLQQALKLLAAASQRDQALSSQASMARASCPDPAYLPFARLLAAPLLKKALLRKKQSFTKRRREERSRTAAEQR